MKSFIVLSALVAVASCGIINSGLPAGPVHPAVGPIVATKRGYANIALEGFSEDDNQDGFVDPVAQAAPVVTYAAAPAFHHVAPAVTYAAAPAVHHVAAPAVYAAAAPAFTYAAAPAFPYAAAPVPAPVVKVEEEVKVEEPVKVEAPVVTYAAAPAVTYAAAPAVHHVAAPAVYAAAAPTFTYAAAPVVHHNVATYTHTVPAGVKTHTYTIGHVAGAPFVAPVVKAEEKPAEE